MKTTSLLVLIAITTQAGLVTAADDESSTTIATVDTSKWKCKFCEVEEGWRGELIAGFGYVTDDSFKFGEYNGLDQQGVFIIGEANLTYRSEDASYLDLSLTDFGLDSRSLRIEGGIQGSYDIFLDYSELPHFISNSAATPYLGSGSDRLTLPQPWLTAGTTGSMTGLAASLQQVDLETKRERLGAGISVTTDSPWGYTVKVRHDSKQGTKPIAGSFFFNSAQLIEPVDYVTDELDAAVSYTAKRWQAKFAYYGSTFSNGNQSLIWDNAYTPAATDTGELALPPDNQFHQLILSAAYDLGVRSRVSGDFAIGRMEQNEALLAATQNCAVSALLCNASTNSANAEVDTTNAKLKFMTMATDKLRLNASYSYDDRDNKTPQLLYDWVTTDTFVAVPRTNLPYSTVHSSIKLKADYYYTKGTSLGLGLDRDTTERSFQEIEKTDENTLRTNLRIRNIDNLFLEFKFAHGERDTSAYQAVAAINPPQNILMSKYNTADRVRDSIGVHANITPHPDYSIGFSLDTSDDDYDNSVLGLIQSRDSSLNIDVTRMLSDDISISVFLGREKIKSSQVGSQAFASPDWSASNDDSFDNTGFAVTYLVIPDKLDIGADYTRARSTGKISVNGGAPGAEFPDLRTDLESIRLYANYRVDESLYLRVAYWHENYDSSDWTLKGVAADTIPNLLSLGEQSPSYSNDVIKLSLSYSF